MSCADEQNCDETVKRRKAIAVLGLMAVIFLVLSAFSFLGSRKQTTPDTIVFDQHGAVEGKRVFQAYNCMGCHTIVGNGAYFGPDLTHLYGSVGSAWLATFLPSAASWPTAGAVSLQLREAAHAAEAGTSSMDEYLQRYPGARERLERRAGQPSHMPNLAFRDGEVGALIAFLKYTSDMNTEGWPPKPKVDGLSFPQATPVRVSMSATMADAGAPDAAPSAARTASAPDAAELGRKTANDYGCMACHSSARERLVGPPWGGLYGSHVELASGASVTADDAYLIASIREPNAAVVAGYPSGIMPSYGTLKDEEVEAIVAYIRSLQGVAK